jgi:hypothetical protein
MIAVPKTVLSDTIARVEWMWTNYHLNAAKRLFDHLTDILAHTQGDIVQVPLDLLTRAREDVRQAVTTRFTDEDRALATRLDNIIATAATRPVGKHRKR